MPQPGYENVDWAFHQQIVDMIVTGLRANGGTLITEVDLVTTSGKTARADIMGAKCGFELGCIEVKTSLVYGDYSQFTGDAFRRMQAAVFSLIPVGGQIQSPNAKVAQIGLAPRVLFPPMRLDLVYALPGQPMRFASIPSGTAIPPEALL
ncbi:MAG: hypothetical protein ACRYG8_13690 [Janthinobacterium lividum]